jgi:hypothetical protein
MLSAISCGIDFGLAHFFDVDGHRHAQALAEFLLEVLDVLALLADHHARTCRVDGDAGVLGRTLDQDARHRGVLQLGLQVLAHLDVFGQHAGEVTVAGVPAAEDQLRLTGRRKPVGWIFCPIVFLGLSCRPSRTCGTWAC